MGENVHEYEALCDSDGLSEDNSGKNKSWNFLAVQYRIISFYMEQLKQATVFLSSVNDFQMAQCKERYFLNKNIFFTDHFSLFILSQLYKHFHLLTKDGDGH